MPAIITHDFFGRDVYDRLFQTIGGSKDEADAFLLGNQGPDPLFYMVAVPRLLPWRKLGSIMHDQKPDELLLAFHDAVDRLPADQQAIGRAYVLGFLCHYLLDSTAHPLIFAQEFALCDAGEPGLSRKDGREVHAVIESELDEMVLTTKTGEDVSTFNPSARILRGSTAVLAAVSKLYAYVALEVYGINVPSDLFAAALHSFRTVQKGFYSPTGAKRAILGAIEQRVRPYSFYAAMSHRPKKALTSQFDNRERNVWTDPFAGVERRESFWDLYERALSAAAEAIELFADAGFDKDGAALITEHRNFSGESVVARLIAVETVEPEPAGDAAAAAEGAPSGSATADDTPSAPATASGTGAPTAH